MVDWSASNSLAVALNKEMYIWNASFGEINHLFSVQPSGETDADGEPIDDYLTSCAWIPYQDNILATGDSQYAVKIWDANEKRCIRTMRSHYSRVASLSWNEHILSSGSRSGVIHHHDVRVRYHHVATLDGHAQEICGLKWSPDGRYLASGSNDNTVVIWDKNYARDPIYVFNEHRAAVKAIAWCPWQSNLLATGGGTYDGKIRLWNIFSGNILQTLDAKSQISCLLWSRQHKELISSHGFQQNQLTIWKYSEKMHKIQELNGHTSRVLQMVLSPDEETVASVGADETLRLWHCFANDDKNKRTKDSGLLEKKAESMFSRSIR